MERVWGEYGASKERVWNEYGTRASDGLRRLRANFFRRLYTSRGVRAIRREQLYRVGRWDGSENDTQTLAAIGTQLAVPQAVAEADCARQRTEGEIGSANVNN